MTSIDNITALIKSNSSNKIVLVLGAKPYERDHFIFNYNNGFNQIPIIIYFDNNDIYPSTNVRAWTDDDILLNNEAYLIGDWNNDILINEFANRFSNSFDLIVSDKGCAHFLKLNSSNLKSYNNMLKNNGCMIFDYFLSCVIFNIDHTKQELMQECIFPKHIDYLDYLHKWCSYHNLLLDIVSNDADEFKYVPLRKNIYSNGLKIQNTNRILMIKII